MKYTSLVYLLFSRLLLLFSQEIYTPGCIYDTCGNPLPAYWINNKIELLGIPQNVSGEAVELIKDVSCVLTSYTRIASAISGRDISLADANGKAIELGLYTNTIELTPQAGAALITALVDNPNISVEFMGSITSDSVAEYASALLLLGMDSREFYVTGRITTTDAAGTKTYGHTLNIDSGAAYSDPATSGGRNFKLNDTSGVRKK